MTHSDGGKGSARRPGDGYQDGWDRIFGGRKRQIAAQIDDRTGLATQIAPVRLGGRLA